MKRFILLTAILALAAVQVYAQPDPGHMRPRGQCGPGMGMRPCGPGGPGGLAMMLEIADKLELTDQQKEQFEKMRLEFQTQMVDHRAAVEKAAIKLRHLTRNDASSEKDVNAAIDEVAKLRAEMRKVQFLHRRQMMSVLTDKQREKLKELRKERIVKMERRIKVIEEGEDNPAPMPEHGHRGM